MKTRVFYTEVEMTSSVVNTWRYSKPHVEHVRSFCEKTQNYANEKNLRIVSIAPVTGGLDGIPPIGGTAITCGFVVVFEELAEAKA